MPRIQSRLHTDELQSTKQALAEATRDMTALRQRLQDQQATLSSAESQVASLSAELTHTQEDLRSAHAMLTEVEGHYTAREQRLQSQVQRMESDIHTLEELVQAARRREASSASSASASPLHVHDRTAPLDKGTESADDCASCVQLRAELRRAQATLQKFTESRETSQDVVWDRAPTPTRRPPRPAPRGPADAMELAPPATLPVASVRSCYWQDQLLSTTQQAAACFEVVQRQTRGLSATLRARARGDDSSTSQGTSSTAAAASIAGADVFSDAAECWRRQLQRLQRDFNEVVQADAKVISFTVLVAEQQSKEIQRLQRQWTAAQETVHEVETVLDEAQARVYAQTQEAQMLRDECAKLTDAQLRCTTQLTAQAQEMQRSTAALQAVREEQQQRAEAHARQVEALTAQMARSTQLQQQATAYAHQLETALQDKQRLLASTVNARSERERQELRAAAEARVGHFVAQLQHSAQQLQSSFSHLTPSSSVKVDEAPRSSTSSAFSPEPSPPAVRSAAGVSSSRSSARHDTRSPSSVPYDDSIFLKNAAQPFELGVSSADKLLFSSPFS